MTSAPATQMAITSMTGLRKAAVLLVLLGDDAATGVYRQLGQADVSRLTQEIAELGYISPDVASSVLQEYYKLTMTQDYLSQGGTEYATKLLVKAFGEEGAKALLDEVMRFQEATVANLDSLQKADPQRLAKFVEGEHPQTVALILAHLGAKQGAAVLMLLSEKTRAEAARRLAKMQQFSPEMVQKISIVLHKKLQALGEQRRRAYGGAQAVAEMLNRLEPSLGMSILESIESEDAKQAAEIRNMMFTFDDLISVPETGIRMLLGQLDKKTLAMALKGTADEIKNHVFKTMSSRAVEMMKEDIEALGPVRSRDVAAAQQEVVALARRLEADGKLSLKSEGEDAYIV
jgi:flagellar motor switch protein FliG